MVWWRWVEAGVEALLLIVLVLLYFDTLRDRPGWSVGRAAQRAAISALIIPIGVVAVMLVPAWLALTLIAVPAVAVGVMALAN